MSNLHKRRLKRHGFSHPSLFDWLIERELKATDPATRWIARRFGITTHHARVVARLSGYVERPE
jgi:hypothetical protein